MTVAAAARLREMARAYDRRLAADALLKAGLGVLFCFFTFGFVFWVSWFAGFFVRAWVGLWPAQFATLVTALFLAVAFWSAWRRVNPLAGLQPLTDQQWFLTLLSQASSSLLYFSPRHASAGFAVLLLGGPANICSGLGIWAARLRADEATIAAGIRLLEQAREHLPVLRIRDRNAAVLLRQLGLIKLVDEDRIALTDRGANLIGRAKSKRR